MIRLTSYDDGKAIYVPVDVVVKENYKFEFSPKSRLPAKERIPLDGAMVVYDGQEYSVKESPEEVVRKVLDWRLKMEKYRLAMDVIMKNMDTFGIGIAQEAEDTLRKIAGLPGLEDEEEESDPGE